MRPENPAPAAAEIAVAAVAGSVFYGVVALVERAVTFWHASVLQGLMFLRGSGRKTASHFCWNCSKEERMLEIRSARKVFYKGQPDEKIALNDLSVTLQAGGCTPHQSD